MSDKLHDAVIDYRFEGKLFSFYIPCTSAEEAKERVKAIRATARFEGWPCFRYSAAPFWLPFGALWTRLRIWLFKRGETK